MKSPLSRIQERATLLLIILVASSISIVFSLQPFNTIPSSGSINYTPEAKLLFKDGFESGDFSAWNGTLATNDDHVTVTSPSSYDGTYEGRFQTSTITSGTKYAYGFVELAPTISEVYARAYFYITSGLPLTDNGDRFGLIGFEVGGQLQCTFRVYRLGDIEKFNIIGLNGPSTVQESTDTVYPIEGQWYCLEFYIKVHSTEGEYRAWINGVEQITLTNLDTTRYGTGVTRVRVGLTATINVQHLVEVHSDCVVISTRYIGQFYTFGVIGSTGETPAIRNFYWLFGNQSIRYKTLTPLEAASSSAIDAFDGLVVWTKQGGYNAVAIKEFAETRIVISNMRDFCNTLYPSLASSTRIVTTSTVTYTRDWGPFRSGNLVEMRNETGNINQLTTVLASALASFDNTSIIACYDSTRIAFFHMKGSIPKSGFYTLDLDTTTPETEWIGIWHVFPALKMVKDFPTGEYALWMANGQSWWDLTWVYNRIDTLIAGNSDIAKKEVIGFSVQGREIPAIFIGTGTRYAIFDGSIHGNEKSGTFACLRVAELLIEYYRNDPYWQARLHEYTVIIVPVLNPDGFAINSRYNANGKDLNRQFPPKGTTTEPEAWALRNLMDNYTPTIYVNNHEAGATYPLHMIYGAYETGDNRSKTIAAMHQANETFASLTHWGWYAGVSPHVWIGEVRTIVVGGGVSGMASDYASWAHGTSCMLTETFVWSSTCKARKSLWAIDYYTAVMIAFLGNIQR